MIEEYSFFDSVKTLEGYDPDYSAKDFNEYMSLFFKNGVFADPLKQLMVEPLRGLTVKLNKGYAFINGHRYKLVQDAELTIEPNTTAYKTKTLIVCQLDESKKTIHCIKREKVSSDLPVRDGNKYELVLAVIELPSGAATIDKSMITDTRKYTKYCGFVTGTVETLNADQFFNQMQGIFDNFMKSIEAIHQEKDPIGALKAEVDSLKNIVNNLTNKVDNMPVIRNGSTPPSSSLGKENDVYLQTVE